MSIRATVVSGALIAAVLGYVVATADWVANRSASENEVIRRTILLRFKADASPEQVRRILGEVRKNLEEIRGIRNVVVGEQTLESTKFTHGISMDFENEAARLRYRADEEHRRTHNDYVHLIDEAQISDIRGR